VNAAGWTIAAAAIVCIVLRPFRISEAWWATAGALGLMLCGAIAPLDALRAAGRGTDVYLFLIGMMALAGFANVEGVFAWIAAYAVRAAGASRARLFALVYGAGIATTALLSNDATVVVLTPAVIAALRRYDAPPLPYVVACALVANAASFVLPISNPSNLLVFAGRMPPLAQWLPVFALPSLAAIGVTFACARWTYRASLTGGTASDPADAAQAPAPLALALLALSACAIVATSALGGPLGVATCACGALTWLAAIIRNRPAGGRIAREIAWPIVVLTAALFVIVAAADAGGGLAASHAVLVWCAHLAAPWPPLATGFAVALAANVANNLPVGLNLGEVMPALHASAQTSAAALIGVNLGPNATVNGSLATVLWLTIVRRADVDVSPLAFARVGIPATIAALAAALLLLPR
jgi:arsenical pump membrane protein